MVGYLQVQSIFLVEASRPELNPADEMKLLWEMWDRSGAGGGLGPFTRRLERDDIGPDHY